MPPTEDPDAISKTPPEPPAPLAFDRPAFHQQAAPEFACALCGAGLTGQYYQANGAPVCSDCRWKAEHESGPPQAGRVGRFGKAALYGLGAAAAGTLVYFLVLWGTGYEIGLIAILVGWMVGKAVFSGSGGVGGRAYQLLAMGLTYVSICASYAPMVVQGLREAQAAETTAGAGAPEGADAAQGSSSVTRSGSTESFVRMAPNGEPDSQPLTQEEMQAALPLPDDPEQMQPGQTYKVDLASSEEELSPALSLVVFTVVVAVIALAAPFLGGLENIFGLFIIAFGLFEAWKHAARPAILFEGPFSAGAAEATRAPALPEAAEAHGE
ncbi:MAG: hypothetical protein GC160_09910 [Acidobacteria bacterium]|nr:hypothetical protein [Acidobacteriota bacterium]